MGCAGKGREMASERFWRLVTQTFVANGTINGVIRVDDASGFKVKAEVVIKSTSQQPLTVEIKNIPDLYTIEVGPKGSEMTTRSSLVGYLISDGASITQPRQKRPSIGPGEIDRAVYEEEPIVARRVIPVGRDGEVIDQSNDGITPQEFDDIILTRDVDKDVVFAEFYNRGQKLWSLDIQRDVDKDVTRVRKINP
jgi:hypothetical protein